MILTMNEVEQTILFENNEYKIILDAMDSPWDNDACIECYSVIHKDTGVINHKTTLYPEALLWCNQLKKDVERYLNEGKAEEVFNDSSSSTLLQ